MVGSISLTLPLDRRRPVIGRIPARVCKNGVLNGLRNWPRLRLRCEVV